jgi:hypothetical protein
MYCVVTRSFFQSQKHLFLQVDYKLLIQTILTAAIMDRDMAKQDYDVIQEQVDQLRDVVSPVDTTVKKSTVLTKQKSVVEYVLHVRLYWR